MRQWPHIARRRHLSQSLGHDTYKMINSTIINVIKTEILQKFTRNHKNSLKLSSQKSNMAFYAKMLQEKDSVYTQLRDRSGRFIRNRFYQIKGSVQHDDLSWRGDLAELNQKCHMNFSLEV